MILELQASFQSNDCYYFVIVHCEIIITDVIECLPSNANSTLKKWNKFIIVSLAIIPLGRLQTELPKGLDSSRYVTN